MTLSDLPAPACSTIEKLTAGGTDITLAALKKGGKTTYHVEGTLQGKDVEYDVDSAGKVVTAQESVPYASLPAAVRIAAQVYFATHEGLTASKELESGKTFYIVTGKKGTAEKELKLTETGKVSKDPGD
jgi:uncharacterized membrane protein YkoI